MTFNNGYDYDGLSERDIGNLNFLITSSKATIKSWMNQVDSDDLDYALLLMNMYHFRLCDLHADRSDLAEARQMLANIGILTPETPQNVVKKQQNS